MAEGTGPGQAYTLLNQYWEEWKDLTPTELMQILRRYGLDITRQRAHQLLQQAAKRRRYPLAPKPKGAGGRPWVT